MNDAPSIGHNQPPDPGDELLRRVAELTANANAWLKERPEIATPEQAGAAQLFIDQILATRDDLTAQWAKEREPFDQELVMLRVRYADPTALLDLSLSAMRAKAGVWLEKQRERLAQEKAERERLAITLRSLADQLAHDAAQPGATVEDQLAAKRAETAANQAEKDAGKKPTRAQIKGDYAARAMTLRQTWHARITDETKALEFFCARGGSRQALLAVALKEAGAMARHEKRADKAPPGVEFFSTEKAQ